MPAIEKIELLRAGIPRRTAFEISRGTFTTANRVFVKVTLADGTTGYGEYSTLEGKGDRGSVAVCSEETQSSCYAVIKDQIGPTILGLDALNMAGIHRAIAEVSLMNPQAKAGVDMAVYDAAGKFLCVPVYVLLGGAYRKEIPLGPIGGHPD